MQLLPKHIHLIPVDTETTLFFHPETLQIYPFKNDNEVLLFLKHLKEKGENNTKQQYDDDCCHKGAFYLSLLPQMYFEFK